MASGNTKYGNGALENNTVNSSPDGDGANNNSAFGIAALKNSTKYWNTAVGAYSGYTTTDGISNTSVGTNTLFKNTTGSYNTALGTAAMCFNVDGIKNTAVGSNAMEYNTSGNDNVAIGANALYRNTIGANNIAIGTSALENNDNDGILAESGRNNCALGFWALKANTTGYRNFAIGTEALELNNTGYGNIGIGVKTLSANTVGNNNIAIGDRALRNFDVASTSGTCNIAIGSFSMEGLTGTVGGFTGTNNIGLGISTLRFNTSGTDNVAIGTSALISNTTGGSNVAIGTSALGSHQSNDSTAGNVAIGLSALSLDVSGVGNIAIGENSLGRVTSNYNVAIGQGSMLGVIGGSTGGSNVAVGYRTLFSNQGGINNVAVGTSALNANTSGQRNNALGLNALNKNVSAQANNAFGSYALENINTGDAGSSNSGDNSAFGDYTLNQITSGRDNSAFGAGALEKLSTGNLNTALGFYAGRGNTGVSGGDNNTFLGAYTDVFSSNYSYSTALGYGAQITASNQIMMGTTGEQVVIPGSAYLTNPNISLTYNDQSVVPKIYVDLIQAGITVTLSCQCATTGTVNLSPATITGSIDGVTLVDGIRVLVKSQGAVTSNENTPNTDNGIYVYDLATTTLVRATDCLSGDVAGQLCYVEEGGLLNGSTAFIQIAKPGVVGTNNLQYTIYYQINFLSGSGLITTGSTISVNPYLSGPGNQFLQFVGIGTGGNTGFALDTGSKDALINNITVGKGSGSISTNTAVGNLALSSNTTGSESTGVGVQALGNNLGGIRNTALGYESLGTNVGGVQNTAVGHTSLLFNSAGNYNSAFGDSALRTNQSGSSNVAVGLGSLYSNVTSDGNVAVGTNALYHNTTSPNTAVGTSALYSNVTGVNNVAVGTGVLQSSNADNNTAVGTAALQSNIVSGNCAFGFRSLYSLNGGSGRNTAVGFSSLSSSTIGGNNTALGSEAASSLTSGANVTCLGNNAQPTSGIVNNEITLGDSAITALRCQVTSITGLSDARDKKDIVELNAGLDFVEKLKPVSFTWNMRDGGKVDIPDTGFIAQDLKQVQIDTGITIPGLVYESNPEKLEASYGKLLPVLVKAIQDLKKEVDELKAKLNA